MIFKMRSLSYTNREFDAKEHSSCLAKASTNGIANKTTGKSQTFFLLRKIFGLINILHRAQTSKKSRQNQPIEIVYWTKTTLFVFHNQKPASILILEFLKSNCFLQLEISNKQFLSSIQNVRKLQNIKRFWLWSGSFINRRKPFLFGWGGIVEWIVWGGEWWSDSTDRFVWLCAEWTGSSHSTPHGNKLILNGIHAHPIHRRHHLWIRRFYSHCRVSAIHFATSTILSIGVLWARYPGWGPDQNGFWSYRPRQKPPLIRPTQSDWSVLWLDYRALEAPCALKVRSKTSSDQTIVRSKVIPWSD